MRNEEEHIEDCVQRPFPLDPMKFLMDKAREDRASPRGIPYLYLSNRKETALSEVRPWLDRSSLLLSKTGRKLISFDFSTDERPVP